MLLIPRQRRQMEQQQKSKIQNERINKQTTHSRAYMLYYLRFSEDSHLAPLRISH